MFLILVSQFRFVFLRSFGPCKYKVWHRPEYEMNWDILV